MFTDEIHACADRSVLCWLATSTATPRCIFLVDDAAVDRIWAPGYLLDGDEVTQESQMAAAMKGYGVKPL